MTEEDNFKRYIEYEAVLAELFKQLGLKANQSNLIRAFLLVSKGKSVFEASFSDLGNVMHKRKPNSRQDTNAKNVFKTLEKWQEEHGIQLIRVLRVGQKVEKNGVTEYIKSQYEFVALKELVKILYSNSENLQEAIEESLAELKAQYKPNERAKKYSPSLGKLIGRAKNTIYTKFKRIFELATQVDLNPIEQCQEVIDKSQEFINFIGSDWERENNNRKFIEDAENLYQ